MRWLDISTENCSVQRTLDLVGEKWTLLVLRDAFNGVRRFDDLHRHVGVSEPVLADRLRKLVAAGLLETRPYQEPGQRLRHEYRPTDKGWELYPALIALLQWGDRHCADPDGPALVVRHQECGCPVRAVVQCTGDHHTLSHRDTVAAAGPGARSISSHRTARSPVLSLSPWHDSVLR